MFNFDALKEMGNSILTKKKRSRPQRRGSEVPTRISEKHKPAEIRIIQCIRHSADTLFVRLLLI